MLNYGMLQPEADVINNHQVNNSKAVTKVIHFFYRANFKIVSFTWVTKVARTKNHIITTKNNVLYIFNYLNSACVSKGQKKT